MDHLEHQPGQLSEEQWPTPVTMATDIQGQLEWPVRLVEAGVQDQVVVVSMQCMHAWV